MVGCKLRCRNQANLATEAATAGADGRLLWPSLDPRGAEGVGTTVSAHRRSAGRRFVTGRDFAASRPEGDGAMSADNEQRDLAEGVARSADVPVEGASPAQPRQIPPGEVTPNELTDLDVWNADQLAEAVGRAVLEDPDSPVWREARSAAWLADEDLRIAARE